MLFQICIKFVKLVYNETNYLTFILLLNKKIMKKLSFGFDAIPVVNGIIDLICEKSDILYK